MFVIRERLYAHPVRHATPHRGGDHHRPPPRLDPLQTECFSYLVNDTYMNFNLKSFLFPLKVVSGKVSYSAEQQSVMKFLSDGILSSF